MKRILLGTIILLAFNAAIVITQMSCNKEAVAQIANPNSLAQLDKILYLKTVNANDPAAVRGEIWTCDLDGNNKTRLNVVVPDGYRVVTARLSPDGKKIVFAVQIRLTVSQECAIYTCNIDGTTLLKIAEGNLTDGLFDLQGAY